MKEQQRLLTENIKTLENRLRAGLCDRCTVTQDVAKRRQQEFEVSQIQSIQHISLLVGEMTNLKKENRRLRDEIGTLRAALENHVRLCRLSCLHPGRRITVWSVQERGGEVEEVAVHTLYIAQSVEGLDQRSTVPPQAFLQKSSFSSPSGEVSPGRHVLCRPHPIKSSSVTLPWPLSESSDWVSLVAASKPNRPRFPNMIPTSQHTNPSSPQRQVLGSHWLKHSNSQPHVKEPTVVFRLKTTSEHTESQTKHKEKRENPPSNTERVSGEGLRETCEGPLDLSDRGKSKSGKTQRGDSPLVLQGGERLQKSPDKDVKTNPHTHVPVSSPLPAVPRSSSSTPPVKPAKEPSNEPNHKVIKEQEKIEEVNGKTEQNDEKKVPVLTISLRPVVVLETLNSALQKQDSLSTNGKTSSPAAKAGSSSEDQDEEQSVSGQESNQGCKRKRASVETDTDRDSDTNNVQQERKVKITMRTAGKRVPPLQV
ncbi:hypothetical protein PAMP_011584 [Pampus punctatissimus]